MCHHGHRPQQRPEGKRNDYGPPSLLCVLCLCRQRIAEPWQANHGRFGPVVWKSRLISWAVVSEGVPGHVEVGAEGSWSVTRRRTASTTAARWEWSSVASRPAEVMALLGVHAPARARTKVSRS